MRLPRQLAGDTLAHHLQILGYAITRQAGSHLRLTCLSPAEHHITIPRHDPLRIGTLAAILADIAAFHGISRDELLQRLELTS
jgi:predicted RNA binding protein YcfA (HicA-like mRNA interferase family)